MEMPTTTTHVFDSYLAHEFIVLVHRNILLFVTLANKLTSAPQRENREREGERPDMAEEAPPQSKLRVLKKFLVSVRYQFGSTFKAPSATEVPTQLEMRLALGGGRVTGVVGEYE